MAWPKESITGGLQQKYLLLTAPWKAKTRRPRHRKFASPSQSMIRSLSKGGQAGKGFVPQRASSACSPQQSMIGCRFVRRNAKTAGRTCTEENCSSRIAYYGSFDEPGNKVRQGSEISSWMSIRILVRSRVKSGTTRHSVCSASPAVKRALIEFWSVFSSRMIRGKAQAYFISPFVKCPQ